MTQPVTGTTDELSLLAIGTSLVRQRARIARWTFIGCAIAVLTVLWTPALYRASASFTPQGNDPSKSGLASLAGQFGVAVPSAGQAQSPDYYVKLLKSRVLLERLLADTLVVPELGNQRQTIMALFNIALPDPIAREDRAVELLGRAITAAASKNTGIVEVSIATKWRSVSLALITKLVEHVNEFNQVSRHQQAAAERKFVEGRLEMALKDLRSAEDILQQFLKTNRQFSGSPELVLQKDRLQASIDQRRQIYNSLAQSYEEVRLREVRDTPVITVVESPFAPALPEPRGRTKVALLGLMLGGFLGVCLVLLDDTIARWRETGDVEANEFVAAVRTLRSDAMAFILRIVRRRQS